MKQQLEHPGMNILHAPIFPDATQLTGDFSAFQNEFGL